MDQNDFKRLLFDNNGLIWDEQRKLFIRASDLNHNQPTPNLSSSSTQSSNATNYSTTCQAPDGSDDDDTISSAEEDPLVPLLTTIQSQLEKQNQLLTQLLTLFSHK
jgi:hypothetical protein